MGEINLLNENLVNQIAAGEVVERPANAIKELVENSIDAGAKNIVIEIEEGGKKLLRISDDGKGILKEDLELAVTRHATSKIKDEKDLWEIMSLGFRGEALSSIASVSVMSVKSRRINTDIGYELNIEGGNLINMYEVAMNVGTIVTVRDLFFNTPARQKFLKNDTTELMNVSSILYSIALSNPEISFKLIHNGKSVFDLSAVSNFKSRIIDVYGQSFGDALIPIFYDGLDFKLNGFIGKPSISRSTNKHQFFFTNGRFIKQALLASIIKQAYNTMLMEHKNPIFFINISIDPSKIDVNVHPKKVEIRFLNQQDVLRVLYKAVKNALDQTNLIPRAFSEDMSQTFSNRTQNFERPVAIRESVGQAMHFTKKLFEEPDYGRQDERVSGGVTVREDLNVKVLTQLNNCYIVAEENSELILIDQHAGHERVRYEELMDQYENENKQIQNLLIPQSIELRLDEKMIVEENMEVFKSLGFDLQHFGGNTFNIYAVPKFLDKEDPNEIINGVIDDIINNKQASKFQGKSEAVITYMACRSAIKFGQKLSNDEMVSLIRQMNGLKRPYTCPHGRPTMISLNMESLEKMFGRS